MKTIGPIVGRWIQKNLVHGEGDYQGEKFELEPWQQDFLNRLYAFDETTGQRAIRRSLLVLPKGCGKTALVAAISLAELAGPVVPYFDTERDRWGGQARQSPNIPVAAASYAQADRVFGAARDMSEESATLAPHLEFFENRIQLKDRKGRLFKIAAEAGTNDGGLPTCFAADEIHEWTGRKARVHLVIGNSLAKRRGGLELNITTPDAADHGSLLGKMVEAGRRVESGEVEDPSFLFVHWAASDSWDIDDPDELRKAIREATPASWLDIESIAARYEIDRIPEHEFRRYHLAQFVRSSDTWLPAGVWNDREHPTPVEDGSRIVAGFDGSYNGDSTALIGCTMDGYLFEIGVWEKPETERDWKVPRSEVDAAVDAMFARFDVVELACDPARWTLYMDEWIERYGNDRVIEFTQTRSRMAPATAKFYDAAVGGLLSHDGSATLGRHVANATVKPIPGGQYLLQKDHPDRKIDAAVAAVLAFDRATFRREQDTAEVRVELW